jgi:hypothetical protein
MTWNPGRVDLGSVLTRRRQDEMIERKPPPVFVELPVPVQDAIMGRLDETEEQGDRKEHPKAIQPVADFWLYPSS